MQPADLEYIESLSEKEMPEFLQNLSDDEGRELREYIEYTIQQRTAGLDRMFEMSAMMSKYAPNFILQKLIPNFLDPPITGAIAEKMSAKETAGIAGGLTDEYVAETALYMDNERAMQALDRLSIGKARRIFALVCERNPLKALELMEDCPEEQLKKTATEVDWQNFSELHLRNPKHAASLKRARTLFGIEDG